MLQERIEAKWIECFARTFEICQVRRGDPVAILSETLSRQLNVQLAELALLQIGARPFHIVMPSPKQTTEVPIRSTGCSVALDEHPAAVAALKASTMVADLTVEGMLHARETASILEAGSRILYISGEQPEILERLPPDPQLKGKVEQALTLLRNAKTMRVTSLAGTDLEVDVVDAKAGGGWGGVDRPGQIGHWPGGLVAFYPRANAVNGTVVLDVGDINLTFKRYLESRVVLHIENDRIVRIDGDGLDAELTRSYFAAWKDENAYCTAHLGWGMNPLARWDSMVMYDRGDHNGVEQRAFAGNFLFSTGANQFADRFTLGHFDIPMRNCTVMLDDMLVIDQGKLQPQWL